MPLPDSSGRYCLTAEGIHAFSEEFRELKAYFRQLEESIRMSNEAASKK